MPGKQILRSALAAAAMVTAVGAAHAYAEVGDASNILGLAQTATGNVITGMIGSGDEGDVYRVTFATGGLLTVSASSAFIDTQIGLFNAAGQALIGNDDISFANTNSLFSFAITAGTYFIGIGDFRTVAIGSGGTWSLDGLPPASLGTVDRIENTSAIANGTYTINLSLPAVSQVPEPASLALVGLALAAAGAAGRRRKA